ncbi:MAG: endonuclease III [Bacteroidota bacterium]|nr:endonuclease III [Bacteroidota bacterium]
MKKLEKVIDKLNEYFGKPFDYKLKPPSVLDVLIATKLSQNTTDKSSFIAFTNLKKKFKSWEKVAEASLDEIKECIRVCGLANTKAGNIKTMLQNMKKNYGDLDFTFMNDYDNKKIYEEFLQYDGIGVKTASCVLIFAFGRDAFPVDTHVHRVLNRLGIVRTNSPEKTFDQVRKKIPEGKMYELHSNLIKFGRNICKAKSPLCSICFLYGLCEFENKKFFCKKKPALKITENNFIILENI